MDCAGASSVITGSSKERGKQESLIEGGVRREAAVRVSQERLTSQEIQTASRRLGSARKWTLLWIRQKELALPAP